MFSHLQSTKKTGLYAGSHAKAADIALFHPAKHQCSSTAVADAVIQIFDICILCTVITSGSGNFEFLYSDTDTHQPGNGFCYIRAGSHTGIRRRFSRSNGFGIGGTARKAASTAVGTGQHVINGRYQRIHINIKNFRCKCQCSTDNQPQTTHHNH